MSTVHGGQGNIITNGLVLNLDAANPRSYPQPYNGTIWNDLSGNGNNGTLINGVGYNSSNGGSLVFDGVNDYIQTSNINLSSTNAVSVDLWCRIIAYTETPNSADVLFEFSTNFNNVTTGFVVGYADNSSGIFGGNYPITLSLRGNAGFNISYWPKTLVNDLQWHHWCCIFDKSIVGAETYLYIDGILRSGTLTSFNTNSTNNFGNLPFFISGRGATFNANQQLSNIKIYNRALSSQEVLQNYNATRARFGV